MKVEIWGYMCQADQPAYKVETVTVTNMSYPELKTKVYDRIEELRKDGYKGLYAWVRQ